MQMRVLGLLVLLTLAACSGSSPVGQASPTPASQSTPSGRCKLPVYWGDSQNNIHAGFVSVPGGAVSEVAVPSLLPHVYGTTYDSASQKWVGVDRSQLSPDKSRYAYWTGNQAANEVHVVDIAAGTDRVAYSGSVLYIPIAFESDAIYLVHGVQPRQGAFEKLYRLDPSGGTPTLVPGSDRHMYQYGWVLVSDGAAWGIDNRLQDNDYFYSVLRLDLATSQVTRWFEGPFADLLWPLGTDSQHNLYIQGVNVQDIKHGQLWRLAAPDQATQLANPGPISLGDFVAGLSVFVSDSHGAWFAGDGGVWLYSAGGEPKQFMVGPPDREVSPAGPCL